MVRVLVIAEDPSLRDSLRELLTAESDVVAVEETWPGASDVEPDLVLWALGPAHLDVRQTVALAASGISILVIGPESGMAEALQAGARGYLTGDPDPVRVLAAVHAIAAGLQVTDPATPGGVAAGGAARDQPPDGDEPLTAEELTDREQQVLQLLAEGLSNKEIAHRLRVSEHTVKFHVNAVMGKLGAHTRTEAVTRAARRGLISF